ARGVIRHNALNRLTVGELDGSPSGRLERFTALASAAGIETTLSREIGVEIWRKFMLLATMGALSAMTRVALAGIRQHPETWRLAEQGMREVVAVAKGQGVGVTDGGGQRTPALGQGKAPAWRACPAGG